MIEMIGALIETVSALLGSWAWIVLLVGVIASAKLFKLDPKTNKSFLPFLAAVILAGGIFIWHYRAQMVSDTYRFGAGAYRMSTDQPIDRRYWK